MLETSMNNGPTATTLTNNLIRLEGHEHNYDFQFRHYVEHVVSTTRDLLLYLNSRDFSTTRGMLTSWRPPGSSTTGASERHE